MTYTPDNDVMEAYRRQMLEMYQKATPSPAPITVEDNWLDNRFPEPNIEQDKATISPPTPEPNPQSNTPDTADFVGYLRVFTFTANGAEPIPNARVIVTQPDSDAQTIFANLTTDADGFTPVVALPSVDPALTLRPGIAQPYVTYAVRITADGFQSVEHRNIPIYGDNYVTQPVAMIPILPGRDAHTQEFTSDGPASL